MHLKGYSKNVNNILFSAGLKELLHPAVVTRTPLTTRWSDTLITYVTSVRRLIMVARRVATHSWAGSLSTPRN